jgi:AcrR family transcriptional regulator
MSVKTRREREREEMRQRILGAARELFATQGFEAVTMRSIAEKIDYTPTCIYFHFADKEALLRQVCAEDLASFFNEMREDKTVADPVERIRFQGMRYLEFARKHPNQYRLLFMVKVPTLSDADGPGAHDTEQDAYGYLTRCCAEAIAAGRFRADVTDADLLAQTFWAGVHGVASLYLVKCDSEWVAWKGFEEAGCIMLDSLIRGLEAPTQRNAAAVDAQRGEGQSPQAKPPQVTSQQTTTRQAKLQEA